MNLLDIVITTGAAKMWSWIIATVIFILWEFKIIRSSDDNGGYLNLPDFEAIAKFIGVLFLYMIFWIIWLLIY